MTFAIAPMSADHVSESAALLDHWYARARRRPFAAVGAAAAIAPAAGYDSRERVARLLDVPGVEAVVAHGSRARFAGYLAAAPAEAGGDGRPDGHGGPRAVLVGHAGHAVRRGCEEAAVRELYAAVAERLVSRGRLVHHVDLPADDTVALAWFRLGFGLEEVRGVLPVRGTGRQPRGVDGLGIRRAGPADLAPVGRMAAEAAACRRRAAVFQPQPEEVLAHQRTRYRDALADPRCGAWLAVRGGEEVGMMIVTPAPTGPFTSEETAELAEVHVDPAARGAGVSRILLATALAWAFGRGYRQLSASWPSGSPLSAGHWPALGFAPVTYRLCRVVDPGVLPGA